MMSNHDGSPTLAGLADEVADLRRQVSSLLPANPENPDRQFWGKGENCNFSDPTSGLDFVVSNYSCLSLYQSVREDKGRGVG